MRCKIAHTLRIMCSVIVPSVSSTALILRAVNRFENFKEHASTGKSKNPPSRDGADWSLVSSYQIPVQPDNRLWIDLINWIKMIGCESIWRFQRARPHSPSGNSGNPAANDWTDCLVFLVFLVLSTRSQLSRMKSVGYMSINQSWRAWHHHGNQTRG